MNGLMRFFCFGLCLCFLAGSWNFIGASEQKVPSATIKVTPLGERKGFGEHYLHVENFPKNCDFEIQLKRSAQEDSSEYRVNKLRIDEQGVLHVNGRPCSAYGFRSLTYLPGERVTYCVLFADGTRISEGSYFPRPIEATSAKGTFSLSAELVGLNPATYRIIPKGLDSQEVAKFSSQSFDEVLTHDLPFVPCGFLYTPGVVGHAGGYARLEITRKSGDTAAINVPWGEAIAAPYLREQNTRQDAPEFQVYQPR